MKTKSKPAQGVRICETKFQVVRAFDDDESGLFTVYCKKVLFYYILID